MKKYLYTILFCSLIAANAFSQTDAQSVLDKVSAKVKSAKGISASFSLMQFDKAHHATGTSKGIVKIKDKKYYIKQDETEIFSNGVQTWNFDGGTEVTVSKVDVSNTDELSPQQILTGFNKSDFNAKLLSSSGTDYEIVLLPVDKRKNFSQVTLYINKSTNLISRAKISDKTGNTFQLSFSAVNLNAALPDSQFVFDAAKHPNAEIINE